MKKFVLPLLVVALFLAATLPAAAEDGGYVRIVIPAAHISTSIQPVFWDVEKERWGEPNHATAWYLAPDYPQEIYLHRLGLGAELDRLRPGDLTYLYRDWSRNSEPVQLRVIKEPEPIDALSVDDILKTGGDLFAIITCEGSSRRLVIWARVNSSPRWSGRRLWP